jgi:hypothetical protein
MAVPIRNAATELAEQAGLTDDFWDVVLSDEDWLEAEFDALVSAIDDVLPPVPPARRERSGPERPRPSPREPSRPHEAPRSRARTWPARQRGPPRRG